MATSAAAPRSTGPRLLTIADLAALPEELPSGPVKYELDNGRLVTMAPPGGEHARMQIEIGAILWNHVKARKLGQVFAEVGVILRRNPDRVVGPDAAFVAKRSLPVRMSPEGYLETIPELIVEVRSKNDSLSELRAKADEYLDSGVHIVWVIDSSSRTVTVYRPRAAAKKLHLGEVFTSEKLLPGFRCPLSELFAG